MFIFSYLKKLNKLVVFFILFVINVVILMYFFKEDVFKIYINKQIDKVNIELKKHCDCEFNYKEINLFVVDGERLVVFVQPTFKLNDFKVDIGNFNILLQDKKIEINIDNFKLNEKFYQDFKMYLVLNLKIADEVKIEQIEKELRDFFYKTKIKHNTNFQIYDTKLSVEEILDISLLLDIEKEKIKEIKFNFSNFNLERFLKILEIKKEDWNSLLKEQIFLRDLEDFEKNILNSFFDESNLFEIISKYPHNKENIILNKKSEELR